MTHEPTPRERAETLFAKWEGHHEPFLDTDWMNPEDREPFIGGIEQTIKDALAYQESKRT